MQLILVEPGPGSLHRAMEVHCKKKMTTPEQLRVSHEVR